MIIIILHNLNLVFSLSGTEQEVESSEFKNNVINKCLSPRIIKFNATLVYAVRKIIFLNRPTPIPFVFCFIIRPQRLQENSSNAMMSTQSDIKSSFYIGLGLEYRLGSPEV